MEIYRYGSRIRMAWSIIQAYLEFCNLDSDCFKRYVINVCVVIGHSQHKHWQTDMNLLVPGLPQLFLSDNTLLLSNCNLFNFFNNPFFNRRFNINLLIDFQKILGPEGCNGMPHFWTSWYMNTGGNPNRWLWKILVYLSAIFGLKHIVHELLRDTKMTVTVKSFGS